MKRLLILRHGKSDWEAEYATDHDRPLAKRGRKAAETMGRFLAAIGLIPDLALTSSALRARTTVEIAADAGAWDCPVVESDALYDGGVTETLARIREVGDEVGILLVAGHEPTWSSLAAELTGGGLLRMVTGATARIDLAVETFREVSRGRGELAWLVTPKLLQRAGLPGRDG